ncbi:Uncharacterised protein [Mycobacteroides abscessus subsp. abscessus]|nr:Uncharacterised protein [Mycobacteroides abscessus subsp. abscessus]
MYDNPCPNGKPTANSRASYQRYPTNNPSPYRTCECSPGKFRYAGQSCNRNGTVSANRPDGSTRPNNTSATPPPPACPNRPPSRIAGTAAATGVNRTTPPCASTTTVFGCTRTISCNNRSCSAGSSMSSRSNPSDS